jgi:hypothetical protein
MSTIERTVDAAPDTTGDWRELARRAGDGLEIALVWSRSADSVKVTVLDAKLGESFDLDIAGADALRAFYHPFAYASGRGLGFGDAMCESLDLQAQK